MKKFVSYTILFWGVFLTLAVFVCPVAYAADDWCGVDTDFNSTVDNACPEPDKDNDKYPSSNAWDGPHGVGVVDCDDNDFWIQPGFETASGCVAGSYRTCLPDGTYTACATKASFTCHTGSGKTIWYGASGVTTAGCGTTYATPCNWFCPYNSALACFDAFDPGDCGVHQAGSYTGTWSDGGTSRQIYINNRDGTLTNPISIRAEPGPQPGYAGSVKFNGAGTSPTEVQLIYTIDSNYLKFKGIEIDGTSDYSNTGIWIAGGTAPEIFLNYIHDIGGESNNNLSGVKCTNDTNGCNIHQNFFKNNCEVGDCTNQNSGHVTVMDDLGIVTINDNIIFGNQVGFGLRIKHADDNVTPSISRNFVKAVQQYAIGSENKDTTVTNNWIQDCNAYAFLYGAVGSTSAWWKDSEFSYNTLQRCAFLNAPVTWDDSTGHQNYSGTTIFTADHNIMSDNAASYPGDEETGVTRICEYNCDNGEFAAASGKAIWSNNVYFSSGTSSLRFGYFGQAGGGADYAGLTAWQTAGFDVGSVQDDPALDSDGISAEYPDHGWRVGVFTMSGEPTPTPTPTPAPSSANGIVPWIH